MDVHATMLLHQKFDVVYYAWSGGRPLLSILATHLGAACVPSTSQEVSPCNTHSVNPTAANLSMDRVQMETDAGGDKSQNFCASEYITSCIA